MKNKLLFAMVFVLSCQFSFAKKVTFRVDMSLQSINIDGVFITGDFQSEAGLGTDFATLSPMTASKNGIYSLTVDLPAHRKYEYKFANGAFFYDVEFVPVESRVGYDFVDNRFIYVDSTSTDTLILPAILYGENAPAGLNLARVFVDMGNENVSSAGVHVAGNFNNWNTNNLGLYAFVNNIYEGIAYFAGSELQYKFINGNTLSASEIVPSSCGNNGYRTLAINGPSTSNVVCYNHCEACVTGISNWNAANTSCVYPNPISNVNSKLKIRNNFQIQSIRLFQNNGQLIKYINQIGSKNYEFLIEGIASGNYYLQINNEKNQTQTHQISIQ
jgi:hypothetical protein